MEQKLLLIILLVVLAVIIIWWNSQSNAAKSNVYTNNIYLDNNGTTKPHAAVVRAVADASYLGNASGSYAWEGKMKIDELCNQVLEWCVGEPGTSIKDTHAVIITSGASEANNFIIRGVVDGNAGRLAPTVPHVVLSSFEHKTSLECVKQLAAEGRVTYTMVAPDMYGNISADAVAAVLKPETVLISVMHANNEIGNIVDIEAIARMARVRGVPFHTDAVQTFGKTRIPMNTGISALSMSFHKMHGPPGLGVLVVEKSLLKQMPAQIAGSQNGGFRGGTENLPAIAGAIKAMEITHADRETKNAKMQRMKDIIIDGLSAHFASLRFEELAGMTDEAAEAKIAGSPVQYDVVGDGPHSMLKAIMFLGPTDSASRPDASRANPNTLMVSVINLREAGNDGPYEKFCNIKLKSSLASDGVIVSIGSACQTGEKGASHVLHAIRAPFVVRCGVVRISLGDYNTESEARVFVKKFIAAVDKQ